MRKKEVKKIRDPLSRDLSKIMEKGKWVRFSDLFELQPKNKTITLRISEDLLNELKKIAQREETDYQKLIRHALIELVIRKAA